MKNEFEGFKINTKFGLGRDHLKEQEKIRRQY
jgi:hypothetical protein